MAEESERRIQQIMDKLFHAPRHKTSSSSSGVVASEQQKGKKPSSRGSLKSFMGHSTVAIGSQADGAPPPCRPWNRGDLTRRLATFKPMTWFAKPKAVSPVNCARRGWVNVEMDTIACEACGARLLFSTPSSWTLQQVEKVAAVFSLKLDSGHKLLCPWIDNTCDESLALFPPTPAPVLVEGYKARSLALLRLSALPIISSSAIDYLRSPQLEYFLTQSSSSTYTLNEGIWLTDGSRNDAVDSAMEVIASSLYHQAQKIISLCGWESRLLPYVVDQEEPSSNSAKKGYSVECPSQILSEQNHSIIICPSIGSAATVGEKSDQQPLEHQYDPASVVLDCKLCGACVGLWAFATVPRPLELFNLIESPEDDGHGGPANCCASLGNGTVEAPRTRNLADDDHDSSKGISAAGCTAPKERSLCLNLTIAGGPPPTKQNFRPTISLPIISRHLRAGFGSSSNVRQHVSSTVFGTNQITAPHSEEHLNGNTSSSLSENAETLKRKRCEYEYDISRGNNLNEQTPPNVYVDIVDHTFRNEERTGDVSSAKYNEQGLPLLHEGSCSHVSENSKECMQNRQEDLDGSATVTEDAANGRSLDAKREAGISLQPGESPFTIPDTSVAIMADEACENNSLIETAAAFNKDHDGYSRENISHHDVTSQNHDISGGNNLNEQTPQNVYVDIVDQTFRNEERTGDVSSAKYNEQGLPLLHEGSFAHVSENSKECMQNRQEDLDGSATVTEDAANGRSLDAEREAGISLQPGESPCTIPDSSVAIMADEVCENNSLIETAAACNKDHDGYSRENISHHDVTSQNHDNTPHIAFSSAANPNVHDTDCINIGEGDKSYDIQNYEDTSFNNQKDNGLKNMTLLPVNKEILAANSSGNNLKPTMQWDDTNKFDPIRQHRPFCPWIAPMDGEAVPGWKLTLCALVQERDSSHALHIEAPSSLSDEADDPIASIRKLFASPPSKRLKNTP